MSIRDRATKLARSAAVTAVRARESDAAKNIDFAELAEAAKDASGVQNRRGEVKKWRLAKAAANPVAAGGKVVKAVARESAKQQRAGRKTESGT